MNKKQLNQTKWKIVYPCYNERQNCQHPVNPHLTCGKYGKVLRLVSNGPGRWVCVEHAKDYKIVGNWARTWQRDFKVSEHWWF